MTTERDDIEKWLNGINKFVTKLSEPASYKPMGLIESHGELRELYFNHCSKLLALVRCYREANQFYAEQFTWSRVGADAQHMGAEPGFDFASMYADKARAAEQRAEEIIK